MGKGTRKKSVARLGRLKKGFALASGKTPKTAPGKSAVKAKTQAATKEIKRRLVGTSRVKREASRRDMEVIRDKQRQDKETGANTRRRR